MDERVLVSLKNVLDKAKKVDTFNINLDPDCTYF